MPTLPPLPLDAADRTELVRLSWAGELACVRRRALMLLDLNEGKRRKDVATKYSLNRDTVADTEKAWLARGYLALYPRHGGGVERKISVAACEAIADWATADALNSSQIRARLAETFAIDASAKLVVTALKQMGFVWKRTRCWLKKKRDPIDFEQAAILVSALLDQAENGEISMAYVDEAGFSTIQPNRSCWTQEGEVHAINAIRGPRLNVSGALLSDGSLVTTEKWGTNKAEDHLAFLTKLVNHVKPTMEKPLYAVIDNASIHKAKAIQDGIKALEEKGLRLYFLPPYSPELNRIEMLWRHIKYVWMKFRCWTQLTLKAEVHRILAGFGLEFKLAFRAVAASAEKR